VDRAMREDKEGAEMIGGEREGRGEEDMEGRRRGRKHRSQGHF